MTEGGIQLGPIQLAEKPVVIETAENPVIRVKWNEGFRLPKPTTLPAELPVDRGFGAKHTPIATYDLEIIRGEGKDEQLIRGQVSVLADTMVHINPIDHLGQNQTPPDVILSPDGDPIIKTKIVQGERGIQFVAVEPPLIITVTTEGTSTRHSSNVHGFKHFLTYKGHVYEGEGDVVSGVHSAMNTGFNKWSEKEAHVGGNGILYLPYNEATFENLEFVIGDTSPKPQAA